MSNDENQFDHSRRLVEGCKTGMHMYKIAGLVPDGDMTSVKMACGLCGNVRIESKKLNVNDLIQTEENTPKKEEELPPGIPAEVLIAKARHDKEQVSDNFWDNVKRGKSE